MKWFRIIRPQTLFASLCPVLVGLGISGIVSWSLALLTVICALGLQIMSNLINDYYDYQRGADKKGRAGFKRALAEGEVSEKQMRNACIIALVGVLLTGAPLVWHRPVILAIGLTAILFAWLYTATQHSLSYLGIADIFVWLYYGVLAVIGTVWIQRNDCGCLTTAFWAGSAVGLISECVLMINNLRDEQDDRNAGKRTIVVRLGRKTALVLMLIVIALVPVCAWCAWGWCWAMIADLPLLAVFCRVATATNGKQYNLSLLCVGLTNLLFAILICFHV